MGDEDAKRLILRRRARFVALALASAGVASAGLQACGGETASDDSNQKADADPQPCLTAPLEDVSVPEPCLGRRLPDAAEDVEIQIDASVEDAAIDADAEPQPCLVPPAP